MGKQKLWQRILVLAAAAAVSWLVLWLLGPVLLPFAVGYLVARAADPAVRFLGKRLPRWLASALCVTGLYGALAGGLWLLCRVLCREAGGFIRTLPSLLQSLAGPAERIEQWLLEFAGKLPDGIGEALQEGVSEFFENGSGLAGEAYQWAFSFAKTLLVKVPDLALFLLTAVLSGYMFSAELSALQALWQRKAPAAWQQRVGQVMGRLRETLGHWCKAQLKLMTVTFLILTAGFLFLQVDYPLLFGMGVAVIDALPVLGVGTVLIPWGLWVLIQGNTFCGVGLLCLYGAVTLIHTALEPQLLGKQMGLDPLLTLLALYSGYCFLGVAGMLLFPIGAILGKQLWDYVGRRHEA